MSDMSREEILKLVNSKSWFHAYEIVPGIVTPGKIRVEAKLMLDYFGVPADLSGKRALDIGALDGTYAFDLERRGAHVVALDIQDPDHTGFNAAKKIKNSAVDYVKCDVYDLPREFDGGFDLVLFFGVYYHLKKPLLALERIWQALNPQGIVYFEGAVLNHANKIDSFWKEREELLRQISSLPVTYFTSGAFANDASNFFIPTRACLEEWLRATGFQQIRILEPLNKEFSRAAGSAMKDPAFVHSEHLLF